MGVDASTRGVGICVVENGKIKSVSKLRLSTKKDIKGRLGEIRTWFPAIVGLYTPDFVLVEEPVMIQNPLATKYISYVVGIIYAECVVRELDVGDVSPTSWKSLMGAKPVTKGEKIALAKKHGDKEARKIAQKLRKSRVQDILRKSHPHFNWDDNDVADSAGIALYAWEKWGDK